MYACGCYTTYMTSDNSKLLHLTHDCFHTPGLCISASLLQKIQKSMSLGISEHRQLAPDVGLTSQVCHLVKGVA